MNTLKTVEIPMDLDSATLTMSKNALREITNLLTLAERCADGEFDRSYLGLQLCMTLKHWQRTYPKASAHQ